MPIPDPDPRPRSQTQIQIPDPDPRPRSQTQIPDYVANGNKVCFLCRGARVLKFEKSVHEKFGQRFGGGVGWHFARGVRRFWVWNCHFTSCSGVWVSETGVIRPLLGPKSRTPRAKTPCSDPANQKARCQTQTPDPRPQTPDPKPQIPNPRSKLQIQTQ